MSPGATDVFEESQKQVELDSTLSFMVWMVNGVLALSELIFHSLAKSHPIRRSSAELSLVASSDRLPIYSRTRSRTSSRANAPKVLQQRKIFSNAYNIIPKLFLASLNSSYLDNAHLIF